MQAMKKCMILLTGAVVSMALLTACTTAVTPVYLVRHAEKGTGTNPDLTPVGQARAHELRLTRRTA
jgi:hypothetical protein